MSEIPLNFDPVMYYQLLYISYFGNLSECSQYVPSSKRFDSLYIEGLKAEFQGCIMWYGSSVVFWKSPKPYTRSISHDKPLEWGLKHVSTPIICQVIYHLLSTAKHSSIKYTSYVSIILLTDVNLWAKLYKQQQNIDSLSGRDATSRFFCDRTILLIQSESSYVVMWGIPILFITLIACFTSHRSTVQYYSAISVDSLVELINLSRIMNELCSKVVEGDISCRGYYREITPSVFIHKYWSEG